MEELLVDIFPVLLKKLRESRDLWTNIRNMQITFINSRVSKKTERVDNLSRLREREIMHTEDKYILETQRRNIKWFLRNKRE
jgi:hypothetical protein